MYTTCVAPWENWYTAARVMGRVGGSNMFDHGLFFSSSLVYLWEWREREKEREREGERSACGLY